MNNNNVNNKLVGYIFALMGSLSIGVMIIVIILAVKSEAEIPDSAKWYMGQVSEVISVESDIEWVEDSDGDEYSVKVYDCEVIIQYEVDGQIYVCRHKFNNNDQPAMKGDGYYVKVSPDNPERVYKVSADKGDYGIYLGASIFGVVGLIFVIIGLSIVMSGKKKKTKAIDEYGTSMYSENANYGGQMYNNYDYYNGNQGTDYSGTSLDD